MRLVVGRSYSKQQSTRMKAEVMMSAGETKTERSVAGIYPDGGRSIWLSGMLITFKAMSEANPPPFSLHAGTLPMGAVLGRGWC